MIILHIAGIGNNQFNGVCIAVPQHVISQKDFAQAALISVKDVEVKRLLDYPGTQLKYVKPFDVRSLPEPFNKPDIVVFHECYRPDYIKIYKNLLKNNIPYVVIPHGELREEAQRKKRLKKTAANILLFNSFVNHAKAVQCLSPAELEATHFGKRKFVGTNGINMPSFRKEEFSKTGVKFVYIGRYEWRVKGLDLFFEAIKMNADFLRQNKCSFALYGPDDFGRLDQVRNLVKENQVEEFISLNTEIAGEEKLKVLLDADIFIQTSRHEGMPMGILEAMSYGIPCLITEGTTLGSKVGAAGAGWNAATDAKSIAEQLVIAVNSRDEWRHIGDCGIKLVSEEFAWPVVTKAVLEKYNEFISE